jgi:NAD(P)-dependent dehydrogenase (short-subunit alcohol dehydrogenase family)
MTGMTGEIAVVTGGASGIGEACAHLLARSGARVAVLDIDADRARAVATDLDDRSGPHHHLRLDVTDADEVEACARQVESTVGPVSVLVTSAGITHRPTGPEELSVETWDDVVSVDVRGTWLCAVAYGRRMAARGHGSIVTIASITGMRSTRLHSYGPGKAAVIQMTANLATEWGRSGVRVNCVSPGYTRTALLQALIDRGERDVTALEGAAAMGRLVEPEEVARAVGFFAGPDAAAITGVNLPVDAGWLLAPPWQTYGGVPAARS